MLFNTAPFFAFLAIVLALFYASPRPARRWILLAASYYFYASWNPRFIPLLLTLTVIDYVAARWIERASPAARKPLLILSLGANLGFLGFFKYYNFAAANLVSALGMTPGSFALEIVLPLGISFHTFQSMSYVIDVYRGEQAAIENPIDYAVFIAFFPQLVAGPIVRAREFFSDYCDWKPPSGLDLSQGLFLVVLGLTKKMAFADQFALVSDAYFKDVAAHPGSAAAWSAVLSFGLQIFFDFSGYTDMAIGTAKLFGFHFPQNFRRPYLAASITEFWRRWHLSLSRWLRDYLYISLGGNRGGALRTYRNLMLTMLLGGLWHGASWNFVLWGGYHGALLAIERWWRGDAAESERRTWLYPIEAVITFLLVLIGWIPFRAATWGDTQLVLASLIQRPAGPGLLHAWQLWMAVGALAVALAEEHFDGLERMMRAPGWAYAAALALMFFCLELFGVFDVALPFVYFQF